MTIYEVTNNLVSGAFLKCFSIVSRLIMGKVEICFVSLGIIEFYFYRNVY